MTLTGTCVCRLSLDVCRCLLRPPRWTGPAPSSSSTNHQQTTKWNTLTTALTGTCVCRLSLDVCRCLLRPPRWTGPGPSSSTTAVLLRFWGDLRGELCLLRDGDTAAVGSVLKLTSVSALSRVSSDFLPRWRCRDTDLVEEDCSWTLGISSLLQSIV